MFLHVLDSKLQSLICHYVCVIGNRLKYTRRETTARDADKLHNDFNCPMGSSDERDEISHVIVS
jgi:hypothetical protein